jgi:hypothetical protein
MKKGLCIGYSVTELVGYVDEANRLAAAEGFPLTLDRSGWGGHSIETIAYLIDAIIAADNYDFIVLEIATSGWYLPEREFAFYFEQILAVLAAIGIPIMVLSLYVEDVDPRCSPVSNYIKRLTERESIPFLDLAMQVADLPPEERTPLFSDKVHTTPSGAALYGRSLFDFLKTTSLPTIYASAFRSCERVLFVFNVTDLIDDKKPIKFGRNGTFIDFIEFNELEYLKIPIPYPIHLQAVMVMYGPRSGKIRVRSTHNFQFADILAYDEFSYYERSFFSVIKLDVQDELRLFQMSERPKINLRKGEPDMRPRLGRISHLMYKLT